jgi:DNA-binding MarR family transcriptional regulator
MMRVMSERYGFELPLMLGGAFRAIIDDLHAELAQRGHAAARPVHGFALQAIGPDGATISELGRRLGVSKQAAAKTAAGLESLGYAGREPDAGDARATRLRRTREGDDFLRISAEIFEQLRARWVDQLGADRLRALEHDLETMTALGGGARVADLPGWMR